MKNLTELPSWQALCQHYQTINHEHMRDWFQANPKRFLEYSLTHEGILLDYSRNRITADTLPLLFKLAEDCQLQDKISALFSGKNVNTTENRPALHTAHRNETNASDVTAARQRLYHFVDEIHAGKRLSAAGKPYKHIVNIGIGGSYLGPQMCIQALKDYAAAPLQFHFLSTVDPDHIRDIQQEIDPETTLFIISSKSFTTIETLTNAKTMAQFLAEAIGPDAFNKQAVAVTAKPELAAAFGIPPDQIFQFKEGIGGRYSIWSAIGLPLVLMIGTRQFSEFLHGAKSMDEHFQQAPFAENMPVIMALLGIWYFNFFHAASLAIIPYSYRLRSFVSYIQQLEMESNGKSVGLDGEALTYPTCPVIFGEEGCNSQHSFYQLLHQGRQLIPIDLILVTAPHASASKVHHDVVLASALSQAYAFTHGKTRAEAHAEAGQKGLHPDEAAILGKHLAIEGNKPNNLVILDKLSPSRLGALIALYEHKTFVQSAIWNINPFDQWGVELGKKTLPGILLQMSQAPAQPFADVATMHLIKHFKHLRDKS